MSNSYRDENGLFYNKLGITEREQLRHVEYTASNLIAESILSGNMKLKHTGYDLKHLQEIHLHLFGRLYDWAGKIRTVESSKGEALSRTITRFESPDNIVESWQNISKMTADFVTSKDWDFSTAKEKLADIMVQANFSHPFPEGNGRTLQIFMTQLAREQNITLDYSKADPEMWNQASALSVPHFRRFEGHLVPREPNRISLNLILNDIARPGAEYTHLPQQNEGFEKLEQSYLELQHLFSPFQKQTAQAALKLIEKMPESVQMQAKTNLYTSQLSEIQQKKSVEEPEIDR